MTQDERPTDFAGGGSGRPAAKLDDPSSVASVARSRITAPEQTSQDPQQEASSGAVRRGVGVRLEGLRAFYGAVEAVQGVDLEFRANEVTAIIGPSGCGKSTMVRCINRMHEEIPTARAEGRVLLEEMDVYDPSVDVVAVRRAIGMVFQKPNPFPTMSIFDNVAAGLRLTSSGRGERSKLAMQAKVEAATISGAPTKSESLLEATTTTVPIAELAPAQVGEDSAPVDLKHDSPAVPRYLLQCPISKETHDLLRYAQALLSHAVPDAEVDQVLQRALKALIPQLEKRKVAALTGRGATGSPEAVRSKAGRRRPRIKPHSIPLDREGPNKPHIPASVRRAVWHRDKGRCTFVGAGGHRCNATSFLEFDHIEPVARGGVATVQGMRLRCRAHNQYEAERVFGTGFMSRKRDEARARRAKPSRGREVRGTKQRKCRLKIPADFVREPLATYRLRRSRNQHRVAVGIKAIPLTHGLGVGGERVVTPGECAHEHEQRGTRQMEVRDHRAHDLKLERREYEEIRLPPRAVLRASITRPGFERAHGSRPHGDHAAALS